MQPWLTAPIAPKWIATWSPPSHEAGSCDTCAERPTANGAYGLPCPNRRRSVTKKRPVGVGVDGDPFPTGNVPSFRRPSRTTIRSAERSTTTRTFRHWSRNGFRSSATSRPRLPERDEQPPAVGTPVHHGHPHRLPELAVRGDDPERRVQRLPDLGHEVGRAVRRGPRHGPFLLLGGHGRGRLRRGLHRLQLLRRLRRIRRRRLTGSRASGAHERRDGKAQPTRPTHGPKHRPEAVATPVARRTPGGRARPGRGSARAASRAASGGRPPAPRSAQAPR